MQKSDRYKIIKAKIAIVAIGAIKYRCMALLSMLYQILFHLERKNNFVAGNP
jgi:hypothetical protein